MMLCGFLAFAAPFAAPWWHLVAIGFGVGAGLTMDGFALWVRLQDVYWTQEGRASLDAAVVAAAFAVLVVLGTKPFGLDDPASIAGTALAVALVFGLAVMCFAKGRVLLGVIGLFVPVVALVGALRLAHPTSPWARWRYSGPRLERAEARFDPTRRATRWQRRIADLVAGAPSTQRSTAVEPSRRQRRGRPTHQAVVASRKTVRTTSKSVFHPRYRIDGQGMVSIVRIRPSTPRVKVRMAVVGVSRYAALIAPSRSITKWRAALVGSSWPASSKAVGGVGSTTGGARRRPGGPGSAGLRTPRRR